MVRTYAEQSEAKKILGLDKVGSKIRQIILAKNSLVMTKFRQFPDMGQMAKIQ